MDLGTKIYTLRTARNMSQGDLANAVEVSRQSISKWETNASVPELDKLVKLSEIFAVSLDELILDRTPRPPEAPAPQVVYVRQSTGSGQKTAGIVLLCFCAPVFLVISLLAGVLSGLALAAPFAACGLICLLVRKHPGLWCLWVVYGFFDIFLRSATGVSWQFAFLGIAYGGGWTVQLILAWLWLLLYAGLTAATVLCLGKAPAVHRRKCAASAALLLAGFLLLGLLPALLPVTDHAILPAYNLLRTALGIVREGLLTAALVFFFRWLRAKRQK